MQIRSEVVGEVKEVVGTVGWWCTWFDKFEEWSPDLISNQRTTWLRCYGVPHHAWGEALFRASECKFGSFVDMDSSTKNMLRLDVARIKIVTDKFSTRDSSMVVFVLDKKFVIKVMEEGGEAAMGDGWRCNGRCEGWTERSSSRGSVDGEAAMTVAEGLSEGDSDGDWSDHDQVLLGVGSQGVGRKGQEGDTRLKELQGKEVSEVDPNLLGNVLTIETDIVNHEAGNILAGSDGCRDAGNLLDESERMLEIVSPKPDRPRDSVGGQREVVGSGLVVGKGTDGVGCSRPISLRTREGDFPIVGPFNEQRCHPKDIGGVGSEVLVVGCNNTLGPVVMATTSLLVGSYNINNGKRKKEKAMLKKNAKKRGGVRGAASMSVESDPIQNSVGRIVVDENSSSNQRQHRGISSGEVGLNVFVPAEVGKEGTTCSMGRRGVAGVGGVGGSGVALIAGEGPSNSIGSPLPSGGSVDKDRSDAHHIIDIQDDLGVNFRGDKEVVVNRILMFEERDRREKSVWEQEHSQ
ncbi:hypothetical protein L195_g010814 [Trifolium pratense]|uniref:Uncharacterized protein n=1 Tax=Trifolium pratense TaxID=57577 RepID=A0A2K3PFQ8_TRIPR|nr:hypothetical protein L195_g010814 [Trifolium pratense]